MKSEALRMNHVTYLEDGNMLLNDFNLHVFTGEILGLLLLNSHGLSALLRLLQHNLPLHYGTVYFNEKIVNSYGNTGDTLNPTQIIERRSHLIDTLSIADNIFVLNRNFADVFVYNRKISDRARLVAEDLEIRLDLDTPVERLTTYQRMEIELMRAVVSGTGLVILDNLVHLLSASELENLHALIRKCAEMGISFIYICDQPAMMEALCDRIAIFRSGGICKMVYNNHEETDGLLNRYVTASFNITKPARDSEDPAREVSLAHVLLIDGGTDDLLANVSLQVNRGEVVLFVDQQPALLQRLTEVIGQERSLQSGTVKTFGKYGEACIFYKIVQNPTHHMLFRNMSVMDNLCFHLDDRLSRVWKPRRIRQNVALELKGAIGDLLKAKNLKKLSQSELYDLVYYKCLLEKPDLAILFCPIDNIDMHLRHSILKRIRMLSAADIAVLILSTDFGLSASPLVERTFWMERADGTRQIQSLTAQDDNA